MGPCPADVAARDRGTCVDGCAAASGSLGVASTDACLASCGPGARPGSSGARTSPRGTAAPRRRCRRRSPRVVPATSPGGRRDSLLAPHAREAVARLIRARFPAAAADARRRADRALQGRVDVLGYHDVCLATNDGAAIDWHRDPVHGRRAPLAHWSRVPDLGSSDRRSQDHLGAQSPPALARTRPRPLSHLRSEISGPASSHSSRAGWRHNPPLTGINWASMLELGLRSSSWIWALHLFVNDSEHAETAGHDEPCLDGGPARRPARPAPAGRTPPVDLLQPEYPFAGRSPGTLCCRPRPARAAGLRAMGGDRSRRARLRERPTRSSPMADMQSSRPTTTATRWTST